MTNPVHSIFPLIRPSFAFIQLPRLTSRSAVWRRLPDRAASPTRALTPAADKKPGNVRRQRILHQEATRSSVLATWNGSKSEEAAMHYAARVDLECEGSGRKRGTQSGVWVQISE